MSEMCDLLTVFKNKFRKIEDLTKKCVNLEGAIKFNKTCLNNRIYPVHVKIYIYILNCPCPFVNPHLATEYLIRQLVSVF